MSYDVALEIARPTELDEVCELFWEVADVMETSRFDVSWRREVYPSVDDLAAPIDARELHVLRSDDEFVGAFVLNRRSVAGYADILWPSGIPDSKQMVLHLLAVRPAFRRQGFARKLVQCAIDLARSAGAHVLRLDVIPSNIPAVKLYESMGFSLAASTQLYYEDTGTIDFNLMELVL